MKLDRILIQGEGPEASRIVKAIENLPEDLFGNRERFQDSMIAVVRHNPIVPDSSGVEISINPKDFGYSGYRLPKTAKEISGNSTCVGFTYKQERYILSFKTQ